MPKTMVAALIGASFLSLLSAPSHGFWQRGQISACSDATSEGERVRLRCWELDPYAATVPSPIGLDMTGRGYRHHSFGGRSGSGMPARRSVARRLG